MSDQLGLCFNFYSLNLGDSGVQTRFGGMYEAFFRAIESCGCRVLLTPSGRLEAGDIAVVPVGGGQEYASIEALRRFGGPTILYTPPAREWFDHGFLEQLAPRTLFAYGTDTSSFSVDAYQSLGIPYVRLPFGSDPAVMRPLEIPPQYDAVFVGSFGHAQRREDYIVPLLEEFGRDRTLVIGSGWERLGVAAQQIEWGPLLNVVYNLGVVCVNVHGAQQVVGQHDQLDANNRLFDLAMAGCCQVCDSPVLVRDYFGADEVVAADDPQSWLAEVRRLVDNPELARRIGARARERALADHSWHGRAQRFVTEATRRHAEWSRRPPRARHFKPAVEARLFAHRVRRTVRRRSLARRN